MINYWLNNNPSGTFYYKTTKQSMPVKLQPLDIAWEAELIWPWHDLVKT